MRNVCSCLVALLVCSSAFTMHGSGRPPPPPLTHSSTSGSPGPTLLLRPQQPDSPATQALRAFAFAMRPPGLLASEQIHAAGSPDFATRFRQRVRAERKAEERIRDRKRNTHYLRNTGLKPSELLNKLEELPASILGICLRGNQIDNRGLVQIIKALKIHQEEQPLRLELVNLTDNQIDDDGAAILARFIERGGLPHLHMLRIRENFLTSAGVEMLREATKKAEYQEPVFLIADKQKEKEAE